MCGEGTVTFFVIEMSPKVCALFCTAHLPGDHHGQNALDESLQDLDEHLIMVLKKFAPKFMCMGMDTNTQLSPCSDGGVVGPFALGAPNHRQTRDCGSLSLDCFAVSSLGGPHSGTA